MEFKDEDDNGVDDRLETGPGLFFSAIIVTLFFFGFIFLFAGLMSGGFFMK